MEEETQLINEGYTLVAKRNDMERTNHADAFYKVITQHAEIGIYEDTIHPNENGAFLSACLFYQMLTGQPATKLKYNGSIKPKVANTLKTVAEQNDVKKINNCI